jgi:GNAT superfamily N-acetyltransferase
MTIRDATPADLPAITAQRAELGWRAFEWALRDAMRPPQARFFVATDGEAGSIVGTGSGISYDRLGVVGNMVVGAQHRGRGLGRAILERVIGFLEVERGCTQLELTATADGRRLYRHYGFEPGPPSAHVTIPRERVPTAAPPAQADVTLVASSGVGPIREYDRPRFGGDREPIIAAAVADPSRPVLVARREDRIVGFAVVSPEAGRLGPWVADDPAAAEALLSGAGSLAPQAGLESHLSTANVAGLAWLRRLGAVVQLADAHMRRGSGVERRMDTIYGSTVGALG